jgi:hypothetical protein
MMSWPRFEAAYGPGAKPATHRTGPHIIQLVQVPSVSIVGDARRFEFRKPVPIHVVLAHATQDAPAHPNRGSVT